MSTTGGGIPAQYLPPLTGSTAIPSLLNNTLGAGFISNIVAAVYVFYNHRAAPVLTAQVYSLFGVLCLQCYIFLQKYGDEGRLMRYSVRSVFSRPSAADICH